MEPVVGELLCPVCLELFTCPIILPCSHILCRTPCAERLFVEDFVRCPVCRDNCFVTGGLPSLPRVISLENIIEQYKITVENVGDQSDTLEPEEDETCGDQDIPCQLCQEEPAKKAVQSCLNCNASYCSKCLRLSHPDREPFTQHQLVQPKVYARPTEPRCPTHEGPVCVWCQTCQVVGCLFCADDPQTHQGHKILSVDEAAAMFKEFLEGNMKTLSLDQNMVHLAVNRGQGRLQAFKDSIQKRKDHINEQCDNMISEIETKREFFLSDLQFEERSKGEGFSQIIEQFQGQIGYIQNLVHYTQAVLKEQDKRAFIQLAKLANDKAKKHPLTQGDTGHEASPMALHRKVVDMRKERAILRDMTYLLAPDKPVIDVDKCSRSVHSVVLVLMSPNQEYEVMDGYRVFYSKNDSLPIDQWGLVEFTTPQEERKCGRVPPSGNAVCLIHDNLDSGSIYYFSVKAYNASGESEMSAVINCSTLSESHSTFPVPEITEHMCHTYSYSIQIHSPSPQDSAAEDISYFLLYREASANKIWKSIGLFGRVDHRTFGLESDTLYDFVIMACNANGECQVSNMVTLQTERAAY